MPRGGSKKGEHRGNAKPRDGIDTPADVMRGAVRMVRKPGTPKKEKGPKQMPKWTKTIESDIQIAQVVHGRRDARDLTPKEIMLENMWHFQNVSYLHEAMIQYVQREPPSEQRTNTIISLEHEAERNKRIASDEAVKVAPYMHPRLVALHTSGAGDKSTNIVQQMLEIIDQRNRDAPMVIEHQPKKRTA